MDQLEEFSTTKLLVGVPTSCLELVLFITGGIFAAEHWKFVSIYSWWLDNISRDRGTNAKMRDSTSRG